MEAYDEKEFDKYVLKGEYGISFLTARLQEMNVELSEKYGRMVVISTYSRIKSMASIQEKLSRKSLAPTMKNMVGHINDIFGVRCICSYQDDLYEIVNILSSCADIRIRKIKDYIKSPKNSGYRSIHIQMEIPLYEVGEIQWIKVELQLRTMAMNFWAELDHQLRYKKESEEAMAVAHALKQYACVAADFDRKMLELRKQIVAL